MATDVRRVQIEGKRLKISVMIDQLDEMLNDDDHEPDCALRCFADDSCLIDHLCGICSDD